MDSEYFIKIKRKTFFKIQSHSFLIMIFLLSLITLPLFSLILFNSELSYQNSQQIRDPFILPYKGDKVISTHKDPFTSPTNFPRTSSTLQSNVSLAVIEGKLEDSESALPYYSKAFYLDNRTHFDLFVPSNYSLYTHKEYSCTFLLDMDSITKELLLVIQERVKEGMGLFVQTNSPTNSYPTEVLPLLNDLLPVSLVVDSNSTQEEVFHTEFENINTRQQDVHHFLTEHISFLSLPQLLNLSKTYPKKDSLVIVSSDKQMPLTVNFSSQSGNVDPYFASHYPIIVSRFYGKGEVIILTAPIRTVANKHLADWPIFTYMVFSLAMSLSGVNDYESFGEWQGSPIPHDPVNLIILIILIVITTITLLGFSFMRKYSKRVPLKLLPVTTPSQTKEDSLPLLEKENGKDAHDSILNPVNSPPAPDKDTETIRENDGNSSSTKKTWDDIGFHKPLAGFSIMFYIAVAMLLPLVLIVMYILPNFILQDPAQFGIMFIIGNIFSAVFIAGDFGLAQAFDKFVGENYIKNPKEAIKYIQFFVWFQMLSGLVQTVGIALIGLYIIPNSMEIAFMSWNFVLKAFVQWPGIGYLWTHSLKAMQRTDKEQMVQLISLILFDVIGISLFSALFLAIGKQDARIGVVIGGAMGISVAEVVKTFGLLIISGIVLNHTEGKRFSIWDCFRVDFDWELAKRTLIFGFKSMLSTVIFLFGNFVVTIFIMLYLPNYTYWGSFLGSATLLLWPIQFMIILYENMLPTNAEAFGAGCTKLTETYISYGFKYFGVFGIFVFFLFIVFVNAFLTAILPPLFKPMGLFIGLYSITKLFMTLGDYSRLFLVSIDRVGQYVVFVTIEQIIRVSLVFFFLTHIELVEKPQYILIWGELPGVILKVLLTWGYTNKNIVKVRINWWQTVVAPFLASLGFSAIGYWFNWLYLWLKEQLSQNALIPTVIFAFFIFGILSMTLYPFLLAFLGGWDDNSLKDMKFAIDHSGPSKPFGKLFYLMTLLGTKKSPLHNRFPIKIEGVEKDIAHLLELKQIGLKQV